MAQEITDYEVVIVGFGPVGAVAACLLGQAGVRTLVIDRSDTLFDKPRAIALDHEIARVLQGIGVMEAMAPFLAPFTDSKFFGPDGRLIKHMTMLPEPHPQGWTPSMVFLQPELERLLRERAASLPCVTIRLNEALATLSQDADHVTLRLKSATGDSAVTARFAIGCDGASSTLRDLAGLSLDDLGFDEPWLVVDLIAHEKGLAKLPQTSAQFCEPQRPTSFVMGTGAHRRFEIRLNEGEDPRVMEQPEAVWGLLARWITPGDARLWRSASYRFHALVARDWRAGRLFIAGDAAHQQPPFLGQGLCQGVRDVANLCWKLALRLRGKGTDALLDSYTSERAQHVRRLTATIKGIGGIVGERDPARAKARDDRLIAEAGGTIRPVPRQDLLPALGPGFLSARAHPACGTLFPQPFVLHDGQRRRMDDVAGRGFRLVLSETLAGQVLDAASLECLGARVLRLAPSTAPDLALQECDGVLRDWFARHQCSAALVRPDHAVFGVASSGAELAQLVDEALAWVAERHGQQ